MLGEEQRAGASLVRGVGVAVQEAHGDGVHARLAQPTGRRRAPRPRRAARARRRPPPRGRRSRRSARAAPAARGFTHANMLARRGMSWRPISSTSRKPAVVSRPVGAPLLSRIALVAVVVPCRTWRSAARARRRRAASALSMPAMKPVDGSSGVVGVLVTQSRPLRLVHQRDVGERPAHVERDGVAGRRAVTGRCAAGRWRLRRSARSGSR